MNITSQENEAIEGGVDDLLVCILGVQRILRWVCREFRDRPSAAQRSFLQQGDWRDFWYCRGFC